MPGRRKKPLQLHVLNGNPSHLTKAEIKERMENESAACMGTQRFKIPACVEMHPDAVDKWREIIKLYTDAGITFVSTSDQTLIGRYCITWAQYLDLVKSIERVKFVYGDDPIKEQTILDGMGFNRSRNQLLTALNAMEDRLYLNPVAKAKAVAVDKNKKTKEETELEARGFKGL